MLTAKQVQERLRENPELLLLDVRTEPEWDIHHIPGATLIPMHTLLARVGELDPHLETIVVCEHGVRSLNVAWYLAEQAGFTRIGNLEGGMAEWDGPEEGSLV
jgi:adenylyltransferase/sulfurtransferase